MATSPKNDKKLMDVAHPGKTAPSASSRPIIVGHGPMLKDPMVQKEETETAKPITITHEKVIAEPEEMKQDVPAPDEPTQPEEPRLKLPDPTEETSPEVAPVVSEVSEPKPAEQSPVAKEPAEAPEVPAAETKPPVDNDNTSSFNGDDGAAVEAVAQASADKKKTDEQQKEIEAQEAKIKELIANKTYVIPLSVASHKRHHRTALIVVLIVLTLLAGAAAYSYQNGLLDSVLSR